MFYFNSIVRFSFLFLFFFLFLSYSLADECSPYSSSCDLCTAQPQCGYRFCNGECQLGFSNGTAQSSRSCGSNNYPDFAWNSGDCDRCGSAGSCSACSTRSSDGCAWCSQRGICLPEYLYSTCPSDSSLLSARSDPQICSNECRRFSFDCGVCLSSPDCGLCDSPSATPVCVAGNNLGPNILELNGTFSCPADNWKFQSFVCTRYGGAFIGSDYDSAAGRRSINSLDQFAVAAVVIISILIPLFLVFILRSFKTFGPHSPPVPREFPSRDSLSEFWRRIFASPSSQWKLLFFHLIVAVLIIASLLLNEWSVGRREIRTPVVGRLQFDAIFGLVTQSVKGSDSEFYPACDWNEIDRNSPNVQRCRVFKAGAYIACISALVGLILLHLIIVIGAFSPRVCFPLDAAIPPPANSSHSRSILPFPPSIPSLFRLFFLFYSSAVFLWALVSHVSLSSYFDRYSSINLGSSWYLSAVAMIIALPLLTISSKYSIWFQLTHHQSVIESNNQNSESGIQMEKREPNSFKTEQLAEDFNELNEVKSSQSSDRFTSSPNFSENSREPISPGFSVKNNESLSEGKFEHEDAFETEDLEDSEQTGILKGHFSSDANE